MKLIGFNFGKKALEQKKDKNKDWDKAAPNFHKKLKR